MSWDDFVLSDISIRKFLIEDYNDVISLWEQAGLPFRPKGRDSKDKIANELNKPTAVFLVAVMNGKIIGTSFGTHDGRKGWINRVAVKKGFHKKGIARLLVIETEKQLFQKGIEIIACLIEDWNDTSMEAFKKMGYVKHEDIIYFSKRKSQDA
jgi:ribosomal protein S18 acetylase RimI-like enzyme